jgi:predicted nucleotidyltransferase
MRSTRLAAEGENAVSPMTRAKVLQQLSACKADLGARFGVTGLALFGSVARDLAREDSDVDVLVSFDGPAISPRFFGVQFYLEDLLGRSVDLVTDKGLGPELRHCIEREAVRV